MLVIPESAQRLSGTQGAAQCGCPWVPALRFAAAGMTKKFGYDFNMEGYSQPLDRAMRPASTRLAAPSFWAASDR
jgi:hypothetical protein